MIKLIFKYLVVLCLVMFIYSFFAITARPFRALRSASPLVGLHTGNLRQYNKAIWAVCIAEIRATVACTCYAIHGRLEQYLKIASGSVPIGLSYFGIPMGTQQPPSSPLNRFFTFLDVFMKYEPYTWCPERETPYYFASIMFN